MYEDCALVAINKAIVNAAKQDVEKHIADFDYELSDRDTVFIADQNQRLFSPRLIDIYNYLEESGENAAKRRMVKRINKEYFDEIIEYKREKIIDAHFSWTHWVRIGLSEYQKGRYERRRCCSIDELNAAEWFRNKADFLVDCWIREQHGGDLAPLCRKIKENDKWCTSESLTDRVAVNFTRYFARKRRAFMEKTEQAIAEKNNALAKIGKHPQSHGGVANLLKVLTKTMHEQGNSIYTIAKVQYQICMQAGIYIPDEFLTDILVAGDMISENAP